MGLTRRLNKKKNGYYGNLGYVRLMFFTYGPHCVGVETGTVTMVRKGLVGWRVSSSSRWTAELHRSMVPRNCLCFLYHEQILLSMRNSLLLALLPKKPWKLASQPKLPIFSYPHIIPPRWLPFLKSGGILPLRLPYTKEESNSLSL